MAIAVLERLLFQWLQLSTRFWSPLTLPCPFRPGVAKSQCCCWLKPTCFNSYWFPPLCIHLCEWSLKSLHNSRWMCCLCSGKGGFMGVQPVLSHRAPCSERPHTHFNVVLHPFWKFLIPLHKRPCIFFFHGAPQIIYWSRYQDLVDIKLFLIGRRWQEQDLELKMHSLCLGNSEMGPFPTWLERIIHHDI